MRGLDMNPVVCHQPRKDQLTARGCLDQVECEPRFPRAGGTANQDCARAGQDRGSVNSWWEVHRRLHRRQPNHKARPEDAFLGSRILATGLPRRHAVLRQQPAIVCFDDLFGD